MKYEILMAGTSELLVKLVNYSISQGWGCLGAPYFTPSNRSPSGWTHINQAMIFIDNNVNTVKL